MLKYGELNLKSIMEKANLQFAHFTYSPKQCSCCYSPKDMPKRYWKNGVIAEDDNYSYILFKNAYNGSGSVTKNDYICESFQSNESKRLRKEKPWRTYKTSYQRVHIEYGNLTEEQMDIVISELQIQLGDEYTVIKPEDEHRCIAILHKNHQEY